MSKRPNILIFNPDQWRGDVLGHVGNPAAVTPNLDRLVATDGVSFRNAFCQNPVCTPSRCSFMTGWYPHTRGHRTMFHMLHHEFGEPNLLRILKDNGYCVWWGGKNDLIPGQGTFDDDCTIKFRPTKEDFERWGHKPARNLHGVTEWRGEPDGDNYYSFYAGRLDTGDDDIYCDGDWANVLGAVDFLRNYDGDQPFCIYLPLEHPHPPYGIDEPWFSITDREKLPERAPAPEGWTGKPSLLQGMWERQNLQSWTEDRWTKLRATYYGMCSRQDHLLGMLMEALNETGLYDNTAVFMFSDHGDFTGDYGLVEKTQNTFEDCLSRVPFVIKPPKDCAVQPRVSDALVELVDFSATVYDLVGAEPGYTHFGKSLLPAIAGDTDRHRDAVFCEGGRLCGELHATKGPGSERDLSPTGLYWPRSSLQYQDDLPYHTKAAMCRTETMKYVRRHHEQDELYDLSKDPMELHNVVDDPAYADRLAALQDRMLTWFMETCDVVPWDTDSR